MKARILLLSYNSCYCSTQASTMSAIRIPGVLPSRSNWSLSSTASGLPRPTIDLDAYYTASSSALSLSSFTSSLNQPRAPLIHGAVYCSGTEHDYGSAALVCLRAAERLLSGTEDVIPLSIDVSDFACCCNYAQSGGQGILSIGRFRPKLDDVVDGHSRVVTIRNSVNLEPLGFLGDSTLPGLLGAVE